MRRCIANMRIFFPGGLNEQQTPSLYECGAGQNFELGLKQSKLKPRKPIDKKGTATNAGAINGFVQLVKRDNSETTLVQANDTMYLWDGAASFTSKGTVAASARMRDAYWSLGDYALVTDLAKATVLKKWDGTTFSTATTGLGATDFYAKYAVPHLSRMWFANITAGSDLSHMIVASALEDPTVLSITRRGGPTVEGGGIFSVGTEALYLLTPDLKPINGIVEFYGSLIISTVGGQLFRLEGTTAATFRWAPYYHGSAAIGNESMASIGNDVAYMKGGGGIDRLSVTQQSGDVTTDDLSRFILTTTKDLAAAITIYDQKNQKALFFVSGKVLVLFKDLITGELSPWSVYKTAQTFAFATNAAKYMKMPGTQIYSVYFGDDVGRIFDLNGSGVAGDAGASNIAVSRKTRFIYDGEGQDRAKGIVGIDLMRKVLHGVVQYRRIFASADLTLSFDWGDEYNTSSSVMTLKGAPTSEAGNYWGGSAYWSQAGVYWNEGLSFAQKISSQRFSPTGKGPGFFLTASLDTTTDFQVDSIDL